MLPWGHVALAYLSYAGFTRWRYEAPPSGSHTVSLGVAAVLPDLVDKPLAWTFTLLPVGRTLLHSLLVLLPLGVVIYWLSRREGRPGTGHAVNAGLLTHALGDALHAVFAEPRWEVPRFLLWPVLSGPAEPDAGYHLLLDPQLGPFYWFQTGLTVVAVAVWYRQGAPGPDWLRRRVVRRRGA